MMYNTFVCDHCGKEHRQDNTQLPRTWVVVNIASPTIKSRVEHWCSSCQIDLNPKKDIELPVRCIKKSIEEPDPSVVENEEEEEDQF